MLLMLLLPATKKSSWRARHEVSQDIHLVLCSMCLFDVLRPLGYTDRSNCWCPIYMHVYNKPDYKGCIQYI
jgi:hypothetical protein